MLRKFGLAALTAGIVLVGAGQAGAATLPDGFVDEPVAIVGVPTSLVPMPDGSLLVTQKDGLARTIDPQGRLVAALTLNIRDRICANSERGLLGAAVDPNFSVNRFVYFYYTRKRSDCGTSTFNGPVNRVSRFTMGANGVVNLSSEVVLLDNMPNRLGIHNAGDLHFGKDGFLYVSVGDGGCHYSISSQCADQNTAARETHTLLGKILRITREGNPATGNPWAGGARCRLGNSSQGQTCAETWARGFRNPFRFAFDPNATDTRGYVNDVGSRTWEEIDDLQRGADYGWNVREGPCATSSTNCGPTGYKNPLFSYHHSDGCASITGGSFVPTDLWPAPYSGSYLFADFVCGKIFRLGSENGALRREEFATDVGPVTNLRFGPTPEGGTALYYTNFDQGGAVRRIRFVGDVNRPPTASMTAEPAAGEAPLPVTFDASGSRDPDGDAITYRLDPGDGSPALDSTTPTLSHTYTTEGRHTASLTVTDAEGQVSQPYTYDVVVGDQPPEVALLSPAPDHEFVVGEQLDVRVSATDQRDGVLDDSAVTMYVERAHDTHRHPYVEETPGKQLLVEAPPPEDIHATRNSHLVVTVVATDSSGLQTTREFEIKPKVVLFLLKANLPNVTFVVNGANVRQDTKLYSWPGYAIYVQAPAQYDLLRRFKWWSDSRTAPRNRTFITPRFDSHYIAEYGF